MVDVDSGHPQPIAAGNALTTVEAAQCLNVSQAFVIEEIDAGRLQGKRIGSQQALLLDDVLAYRNRMRAQRKAALQEMADDERELGLDNY